MGPGPGGPIMCIGGPEFGPGIGPPGGPPPGPVGGAVFGVEPTKQIQNNIIK